MMTEQEEGEEEGHLQPLFDVLRAETQQGALSKVCASASAL